MKRNRDTSVQALQVPPKRGGGGRLSQEPEMQELKGMLEHGQTAPSRLERFLDTAGMWLTSRQVAGMLQIHPVTLATWRQKGMGPKYVKAGHGVRYRLEDVEAWAAQNTVGKVAESVKTRPQGTVKTRKAPVASGGDA